MIFEAVVSIRSRLRISFLKRIRKAIIPVISLFIRINQVLMHGDSLDLFNIHQTAHGFQDGKTRKGRKGRKGRHGEERPNTVGLCAYLRHDVVKYCYRNRNNKEDYYV